MLRLRFRAYGGCYRSGVRSGVKVAKLGFTEEL